LILAIPANKQAGGEREKERAAAQRAGNFSRVGKRSFIRDCNQAALFGVNRDFKALASNPIYRTVRDKEASGQTLPARERK
jgi:hypothetical protein